jgi:PKD repeat protein
MRRLLLTTVGAALAAASILPAAAGAAPHNGDPCGPLYTQASAPAAAFTLSPSSTLTQSAVSFDGSSSSSGTADAWTFVSGDAACEQTSTITDPIVSYKWNFGDGAAETDNTATTTHTYAHAGQYTVGLTVTEKFCQAGTKAHCFTASATHTATIVDRPPVAAFTLSSNVTTGENANFDASTSSDPDGTIAKYHWDFGDGQSLDTTTPVAAHVYTTAGSRTVTLTVTDDSGSTATTQHTVTVTAASATCDAPNLIGRSLAKARTLLISHHCSLGTVRHKHSSRGKRGRVIKQSVQPGSQLPGGSKIGVTVKR